MMYSINLYYNICVLEPLWHELGTKMNTNALKIILLLLVHSSFLLFVPSFQHKKSSKYTMLFKKMSVISLYYNQCVLKSLWHNNSSRINTNTLKLYFSLLEICIIGSIISIHKNTEIYKTLLNYIPYYLYYIQCVIRPLRYE
jgi:hypothetical protein